MKVNPEFIVQKIRGQMVLTAGGYSSLKYHGVMQLNETAAFIADFLKEDHTEEEILEAMKKEYNAPEDVLKQAVEYTLAELRKGNAIVD